MEAEAPDPQSHRLETAGTGRAKCRACGEGIPKGSLRFGEVLSNPFTGHLTPYWFHLECAALRRPEPLAATLAKGTHPEECESVSDLIQEGIRHPRLNRLDSGEFATSGRAKCRQCKAVIAKGGLRCSLVFYEEGRFSPGGFLHWDCVLDYCGAPVTGVRLSGLLKGLPPETELPKGPHEPPSAEASAQQEPEN